MKKTFFGATLTVAIMLLSFLIVPIFGTSQPLSVNAASSAAPTATVSQLWDFTTDSYTASSPVVSDGFVYIRSVTTLYCINASAGTQAWNYSGLPNSGFGTKLLAFFDEGFFIFMREDNVSYLDLSFVLI